MTIICRCNFGHLGEMQQQLYKQFFERDSIAIPSRFHPNPWVGEKRGMKKSYLETRPISAENEKITVKCICDRRAQSMPDGGWNDDGTTKQPVSYGNRLLLIKSIDFLVEISGIEPLTS